MRSLYPKKDTILATTSQGKFRAAPKKTEKDYLRVSAITIIIIIIQPSRMVIWCIAASNVSRECVKVLYTVCDDNLESFNHGTKNAGNGGNFALAPNHNFSVSGVASNWSDQLQE